MLPGSGTFGQILCMSLFRNLASAAGRVEAGQSECAVLALRRAGFTPFSALVLEDSHFPTVVLLLVLLQVLPQQHMGGAASLLEILLRISRNLQATRNPAKFLSVWLALITTTTAIRQAIILSSSPRGA